MTTSRTTTFGETGDLPENETLRLPAKIESSMSCARRREAAFLLFISFRKAAGL